MPSDMSRRGKSLLILIILLGVSVQAWATWQWPANFDSDEAIVGLMSLHLLDGQWTPYFYGQQYMGSLMALAGSAVMALAGPNVLALRLTNLLLYGLFLGLSYVLARRMWGNGAALLATALLALPPYQVLYWTYRPSVNASLLLCLGTGWLLLTLPGADPNGCRKPLGSILVGALAGLGLWTHPMMVIYLAAVGLPWLLQTPEWHVVYRPITQRPALRVAMPLVTLGLVGLALTAFFTGACAPVAVFVFLRLVSRVVLLVAAALVVTMFLWRSPRRADLIRGALLVSGGFLVGNLPQWGAWVWLGIAPTTAVRPSCPMEAVERVRLVFLEMFPILWGGVWPNPFGLPVPGYAALLTLAAASLVLVVIVVYAWRERDMLLRLAALAPTPVEGMAPQVLALLLVIPIALTLLGNNTVDRYAVRYLLPSWQAGMLMLAAVVAGNARLASGTKPFDASVSPVTPSAAQSDSSIGRGSTGVKREILRCAQDNRVRVLAVLVGWTIQVVLGYQVLGQFWETRPHTSEAVAALERALQEAEVSGGYADYWLAYPVTFLTQERLVITPFNGLDRYPRYTEQVGTMTRQAYLLPVGALGAEQSSLADLVAFMRYPHEAGPAAEAHTSDILRQQLVTRRSVASWDVWIVRR